MSVLIEDQLRNAMRRFWRSPMQKLIDPGILKFSDRYLARRRARGVFRSAQLFFGDEMGIVLPEIVSEQIYTYGFFDEVVSWLVLHATKKEETVLDVGAHFGYFSLLFSRLVGNAGRVVAFEPTPSTFELLSSNLKLTSNVTAINCALGEKNEELPLKDYGLRYCAWNTLSAQSRLGGIPTGVKPAEVVVRVRTLDESVKELGISPSLIKIDAENFEEHVVKGGLETIARCLPKVIMETGSVAALAAARQLVALGYKVFTSEGVGSMVRWEGSLDDANVKFKDMLFVPDVKVSRLMTRSV